MRDNRLIYGERKLSLRESRVYEMAKNMEMSLLLDFYDDLLTDKQREVTDMYYNEDMSLSEISEIVGITRQGVRDSIKRAEQIMLDAEQKVGFCKKFTEYRKGLTEIIRISKAIAAQNRGYLYSRITDDGTREIMSIADKLLD